MNERLGEFFLWVAAKQRFLWKAFGGLLALFLVATGAYFWWQGRMEKASEELTAALEKTDMSARLQALEALVQNYSHTPSRNLAEWELANAYAEEKKWDAAKSAYENLYEGAGPPYLKVVALHGLGNLALSQHQYDDAAGYFLRAAKEPKNAAAEQSEFWAAISHSLAGHWDAAEAALKKLQGTATLNPDLRKKVESELLWVLYQKSSSSS